MSNEERPASRRKWWWAGGIGAAGLILGGAVLWWGSGSYGPDPTADSDPAAAHERLAELENQLEAERQARSLLGRLALGQGDTALRERTGNWSASPLWARWLTQQHLIPRLTAAVDAVARGENPRPHLPFAAPEQSFDPTRRGGPAILDDAAGARYTPAIDLLLGIDPAWVIGLYRELEPLFQEAYRDLGYPDGDFRRALAAAATELLRTPPLDTPIRLEPRVLGWAYSDPALQGLSPARQLLLRTGPRNVARLQSRIRELMALLNPPPPPTGGQNP